MKIKAFVITILFFAIVSSFLYAIKERPLRKIINDQPKVGATVYYVSNFGDDSNAGTASTTAWKSIDKIEATSFTAGDTIKFRCGDEWRITDNLTPPNDGSSGNPITFTNYGNCADSDENLPLLMGSWDYGSSTDFWRPGS